MSQVQQHKILLDESEMPTRWYNVLHDLPTPPPPVLHPGTGQPVGPDDLAPLFPMDLILQEVSHRPVRRHPRGGARRLPAVAAEPAVPGAPAGEGARARRRGSTTSTKGSRRPARTSRTPRCRRRSTTPRPGIRKLTTETGAGQWGTALAFACAQFDLECEVWQVRASYDQKPYRRIMIETFGGTVHPSPSDLTEAGRGDPGRAPRLDRVAGHRDQRGGRGRGAGPDHQLRAGQRAQPRADAPDDHRRGGAAAAGEGRGDARPAGRLHRRRLELRRADVPVPAGEVGRPDGAGGACGRAGRVPVADPGHLRLRLRRHRSG